MIAGVVVAWYFLIFSNHPTVVGPFPNKAACEVVRQQVGYPKPSECWSFQYQEVKP
jgi:hypothetical protein